MKTKLILLALLIASPAFAQTQPSVRQTGSITAGHIATWSANQVIQDGGAAPSSTISLGTSTSAANPRISGDATTGLYTAGAGLVDTVISGTKRVEVSSTGQATTGTETITSTSASALAVGANGATNPVLSIDASTGSVATGLAIKGAATGGTTTITATDSGSNTNIGLMPKGTGNVGIGTTLPTSLLTVIGTTTVQTGAAAGAMKIGADVNATTITAGTRKLARVTMPPNDAVSNPILILGGDTSTGNAIYFGGTPNSTTAQAATEINFLTAAAVNTNGGNIVMRINGSPFGVAIGTSYSGVSPPVNGLVVQGNVGIGSSAVNTGVALDLGSNTSSMLLPVGTTGTRPTGISGMTRYNSTTPALEAYVSSRWASVDMTPEVSGYMYNPTNNQFPKLAAAIAKVKANTGNSNWLMMGSSTIAGYCSAWNSWQQPLTMEYLMAQYLQAYGLSTSQANNDSLFGFPAAEPRVVNDTRLTIGAGWGSSATISAGGNMFVNTTTTASGTTNSLSISIPATADKAVIITPQDAGLGTISYRVNAGSTTNIVEAGTAAAIQTTVTLTPGAGNKLNIDRVSGTANFIGVYFYLSTTASVNIFNMGVGGATAGSYLDGSGKPYASPAIYSALSPDFSFIMMMSNDAIANTASATYKANMQLLINQLTTGDLLLGTQIAYSAGAGTIANIAPKIVDLKALAVTNTTAFFDNYSRWGGDSGYANLGNSNMSCDDGLHGNMFGYQAVSWDTLSQAMLVAGFASPPANQYLSLNGGPGGTAIVYHPTAGSIGIGNDALFTAGLAANTGTEGNNVAIGDYDLSGAVPGSGSIRNTMVGYQAGQYITTGDRNTAMGAFALNGNSVSVTGSNNVAIGLSTGGLVTSGSANTILGNHVASTTLTTGSNNVLIGTSTSIDTAAAGTSNTIQIGAGSTAVWSATGAGTPSTAATTFAGSLTLTNLATDATHTDRAICQDTTSKTLFFGSGAAGICLGTSSQRFKKDIVPLMDGLAQVNALQPVNFYYRQGYGDDGAKEQFGFIAEEVVKTLPKVVGLDKDGKPNSVDMMAMVPVLVKAIQEQQKQIDDLKKQKQGNTCYFLCNR